VRLKWVRDFVEGGQTGTSGVKCITKICVFPLQYFRLFIFLFKHYESFAEKGKDSETEGCQRF
jgi:hypothetical protein